MPYAVIRTGGKQYRVQEGDTLRIEKLDAEVGQEIEFDDVLLIGEGENVNVERDALAGAKVKAKVVRQDRARKIHVFKFKRRKGYRRLLGHRQPFTEIRISSIS